MRALKVNPLRGLQETLNLLLHRANQMQYESELSYQNHCDQ
jgi:hypothetical protein